MKKGRFEKLMLTDIETGDLFFCHTDCRWFKSNRGFRKKCILFDADLHPDEKTSEYLRSASCRSEFPLPDVAECK